MHLLYAGQKLITVIHQPHFFPWAGYFNKLANADCFVVQDNVQFRRRYFQNRTLIRGPREQGARWLTLPVHAHRRTLICDVQVSDIHWRNNILDFVGGCYRQAPFFAEYIDAIKKCFEGCSDTLVDVDIRTIQLLLRLLHIKIEICRASDLRCSGTPVECLAQLCKQVSATDYIFGEGGGLAYHGASYLKYNGITPHQQHYRQGYLRFAETYYPARPNLSIMDLLFNLGAQKTSEIVRSFWNIEPAGEGYAEHTR